MQPVLVIDLDKDPASALIIDASDADLPVLERASVAIGNLYARYHHSYNLKSVIQEESSVKNAAAQSEQVSDVPEIVSGKELLQLLVKPLVREWTNSIVIIPPLDYVSIGIDAPFGDASRLSKILTSEVQDAVPFELDEMHMHYRAFQFPGASNFYVHVGLMPKEFISDVINWCSGAGVEATVLCPPSSIIGLCYDVMEGASANAAVICDDYPCMSLGIFVDGKFYSDRVLHAFFDERAEETREAFTRQALQEFRTTLLSFEHQYDIDVSQVILFGEGLKDSMLQELFPHKELLRNDSLLDIHDFMLRRTALFGRDLRPSQPLTDFRSGAFKTGIKWSGVLDGVRQILPYFIMLCCCIIIALATSYFVRKNRLAALQATTVENIRQMIPSIDPNSQNPADFVRNEIGVIQKQLRDLGSPFQLSPLDALLELSKDIPKRGNANIKRVNIVGNKVTIDGTAPNYAALDTLEKAFKKKKRTYCGVKNTVNAVGAGASTSTLNFSFTMELCE